MIYGIGFDLTDIDRIERLLADTKFLSRYFTEYEAEYIKKSGAKSATGIFCAKEAFSKSLGTGISGFSLKDVEVRHNELGKPYFKLYGKIKEKCEEKKLILHLSITHTDKTAGAIAVCETAGE